MPSAFVKRMLAIGKKLEDIVVLPPLPGRMPRGKVARWPRWRRSRMVRGAWIAPRDRPPAKVKR